MSEGVSLQELCQVIQQPDVKVLKNYIKVQLLLSIIHPSITHPFIHHTSLHSSSIHPSTIHTSIYHPPHQHLSVHHHPSAVVCVSPGVLPESQAVAV